MTNSKDLNEQGAVVAEVDIAAPPERVFQALTNANQLFAWWSTEPSVELSLFEMDARPGGRWRFKGRPAPGSDHGDVGEQLKRNAAQAFEAHGEVLEYVPPRVLVWSWIANWHAHPAHPTVVRWELTPTVQRDASPRNAQRPDSGARLAQRLQEWMARCVAVA